MTPGQYPSQPRANPGGILKDKPLYAVFERTGPIERAPNEQWMAEIYRSKAGSMRTNLQRYDFILDAETKKSIILLRAEKIAVVMPLAFEGSPALWGYQQFPLAVAETASIRNIICRKVLLSNFQGGTNDAGELWEGDEYGIVLKDVKPTAAGPIVWQISKISLTEPNPDVFKIPSGFSIHTGTP